MSALLYPGGSCHHWRQRVIAGYSAIAGPSPRAAPRSSGRVSVHRLAPFVALILAVAVLLVPTAQPASAQSKLKVVATVAPITNIVQNVGGGRIDLQGIIPPGVDSHTFEPSPS